MAKKLLAVVLGLSMILVAFAGCSETPDASGGDPAPAAEGDGTPAEEGAGTQGDAGDSGDRLVIATGSDILSLDPYRYDETPTNQILQHFYETLTEFDRDMNLQPCLAESWEEVDDTTWIFNIRQGVKFHDGSELTVDDVIASIEVAKRDDDFHMSAYDNFTAAVASMEAVDDHTLQVTTTKKYPLLATDFSHIMILKAENIVDKTEEEISSVVVGTGRYKFVEHVKEDHVDMEAFADYWGGAPAIQNVRFRPITNEATRTATILSGDVDLAIGIGVRDVERLEATDGINIIMQDGIRNIFLNLDGWRDESPAYKGDGVNPLTDLRVRQAIAHAIDADAIVENIMNGYATVANSYVPPSYNGYSNAERFAYDPEKAKELLAEAGYEDGFTITLDAPPDRYVNDADVAQAIAAYLERVGITVDLNLIPKADFFTHIRITNNETGFFMTGWSDGSGEAVTIMVDMLHTYDPDTGIGSVNRGHYSNAEVDRLIQEAQSESDAARRAELCAEADRIALEEVAYIPIHFEKDIFAVKDSINYTPRINNYVFAWDVEYK